MFHGGKAMRVCVMPKENPSLLKVQGVDYLGIAL